MGPTRQGAVFPMAAALICLTTAGLTFGLEAAGISLERATGQGLLLKPSVALAIVGTSISLWLLVENVTPRIAAALGMLVCLTGVTAIGQSLRVWDFPLDPAWWPISSPTALCLIGLGLSLWAAGVGESSWRVQGLALSVAITATGVLVGHLYGVRDFSSLGSQTTMTPSSAVLLVVLSTGVLLLKPREALTGVFHNDAASGRLARRLLSATILTPIVAGWLVLRGQQAGLYDTSFALALLVLSTLTLLTVVIWINARVIGWLDERRRQADAAAAKSSEAIRLHAEAAAIEGRQRASQRIEALGQLAGSIAHDVNNMMTVVSGYSTVMLQNLESDHELRHGVSEIKKAGDRCIALTRRLLAFSRRQVLVPAVLDLEDMLTDLSGMMPMIVGDHIRIVTSSGPDLWRVRADPAQLEQVIVNLTVNARDAMPDGGTLSIDTANLSVTPGSSFEQLGVPLGDFVRLSVTDTGIGMDEATLAHAFDPFFTTKPAGEGTGLGLSTVYGVIRQSGGHVHAESSQGCGTTIRMLLPRVVAEVEPPPAISQGPSGTGTILLVEDDGSVRDFMAVVLRRAGYTVIEAQSGMDALETESRVAGTIDALVSDVVMHGMNGKELASRLLERRPSLAVLLISGYPKGELPLSPADTFLQKPFGPDQFLMTVSHVLNGAGRAAQSIHTSDGAHER